MRYRNDKTGDWVEFKPGFGKLSMRKAMTAWSLPEGIAPWISKCEFHDAETGAAVALTDAESIYEGLNFHQWDWLSDRLREWARDDVIDPEA